MGDKYVVVGLRLNRNNPEHHDLVRGLEKWQAAGWNASDILRMALEKLFEVVEPPRPNDNWTQLKFIIEQTRPVPEQTLHEFKTLMEELLAQFGDHILARLGETAIRPTPSGPKDSPDGLSDKAKREILKRASIF